MFYTNDRDPIRSGSIDIRAFLADLGVSIQHLPFERFRPPHGFSTSFRNAFYKHEVLEAASQDYDGGLIFLDCDCVCSRHDPGIAPLLGSRSLLLLEVAPHRDPFEKTQDIQGPGRSTALCLE